MPGIRRRSLSIILLSTLLFLPSELSVASQDRNDFSAQDFDRFWRAFRRAVAGHDKIAVAGMTKFPLAGDFDAPTRAVFLRKYNSIFNRDFRRLVAAGKPYVNAGGGYTVVWKDKWYLSFELGDQTYKLAELGTYRI